MSGTFFQVSDLGTRRSAEANDLSRVIRVDGTVLLGPSGPNASVSFFNPGDKSYVAPAISMPYFYHDGLLYSFGPHQPTTMQTVVGKDAIQLSASVDCSPSIAMSLGQGWTMGSVNQPVFVATNATSSNYVVSQGSVITGPAATSIIFGGVQIWPQGGAGLLFPPRSNYLFAISANGSGPVNATIIAYYWAPGTGFVPFANSYGFRMNTMSYQNMTVASDGWGGFSIFLNSTSVLTTRNLSYLPNVGPIGLWVGHDWSMNYEAVFVKTSSTTSSSVPPGSCHTVTIAPFTPASGQPVSILVSKGVTVQLMGLTRLSGSASQLYDLGTWNGNATDLSLKIGNTYFVVLSGLSESTTTAEILNGGFSLLPPSSDIEIDLTVMDATIVSS